MFFLFLQSCLSYTLPQKIDHHDIYKGTFNQTFYLDRTFYLEDSPSIIVYVSGLRPLSARIFEMNNLMKIAEQSKSVLFALEHRYFGTSEVFSTLSSDNLTYFTIEQAIDDIGNFTRYLKQEWCTKSRKCPLVLVGEDFGGTISIWAKQQFPDLIDGVWADSSPLYATNDFDGADSYYSYVFGNFNRNCLSTTSYGLNQINQILTSDNQTAIDELYSQFLETNETIPIKDNFLYALTNFVYSAVESWIQGNPDILFKYCKDISPSNFREKLHEALLQNFTGPLHSFDPTFPKDENDKTMRTKRLWTYLMCHELGWISVSQPEGIAFRIMPSNLNQSYSSESICNELFGFNQESREYFNFHHGGKTPRVTSVIYTNSINSNNTKVMYSEPSDEANEIFSFTYNDYSASALDYQGVYDSPELKNARNVTISTLIEWLTTNSNCNHGVARLHKCVCNKGYTGPLCNLRTMRNEYTSMTTAAVTIPTIVMFLIGILAWCLFIESTKESKPFC